MGDWILKMPLDVFLAWFLFVVLLVAACAFFSWPRRR